ncbi:12651_t:CDS:2 [Acaulospora colombiana]|uniref:12651_t:CDS:1 n=1 Tax=Acaulospora colombiana TaxID=27376 RepID=A0ACA9NDL8_9GLOM|nr:12651_t:CDS:2 [Acaulospora colombiana]
MNPSTQGHGFERSSDIRGMPSTTIFLPHRSFTTAANLATPELEDNQVSQSSRRGLLSGRREWSRVNSFQSDDTPPPTSRSLHTMTEGHNDNATLQGKIPSDPLTHYTYVPSYLNEKGLVTRHIGKVTKVSEVAKADTLPAPLQTPRKGYRTRILNDRMDSYRSIDQPEDHGPIYSPKRREMEGDQGDNKDAIQANINTRQISSVGATLDRDVNKRLMERAVYASSRGTSTKGNLSPSVRPNEATQGAISSAGTIHVALPSPVSKPSLPPPRSTKTMPRSNIPKLWIPTAIDTNHASDPKNLTITTSDISSPTIPKPPPAPILPIGSKGKSSTDINLINRDEEDPMFATTSHGLAENDKSRDDPALHSPVNFDEIFISHSDIDSSGVPPPSDNQ